ncbi:hypothetical protein HELRODRAFT_192478 [Helobdella robusta]|uniref:Ribosomal protein eL8/eL30/eS12/Gadd45 domain-containing protein n=1 Tax=Helobdella robusta TaxID=6412 RepID=T1FU00_HELRO|nr:hypothetical protein HELRODRAFT_192478 [Helobdella robusta]ESO00921.1 hypothetical protein HELRODRAFT_192478 [Helobdella robusta]
MKPNRKLENLNILIASNMERDESYAHDLKDVLKTAHEQGRLTCGIYECGKRLENNPDDIMLCILPVSSKQEDPTLHIHRTLISAFCLEEGIHIVNVSSADSLKNLFTSKFGSVNSDGEDIVYDDVVDDVIGDDVVEGNACSNADSKDYNCLLVEIPIENLSQSEEKILNLLDYYQDEFPLVDLDFIGLRCC